MTMGIIKAGVKANIPGNTQADTPHKPIGPNESKLASSKGRTCSRSVGEASRSRRHPNQNRVNTNAIPAKTAPAENAIFQPKPTGLAGNNGMRAANKTSAAA